MRNVLDRLKRKLNSLHSLDAIAEFEARTYYDALKESLRKKDDRRLELFGFKVYSQNEEDGILREIFERIGSGNRRFVEIGVQDGLENNSALLLTQGWKGMWVEGSADYANAAEKNADPFIRTGQLRVEKRWITVESAGQLLNEHLNGEMLDLFGLDIDGNDYHILRSIGRPPARVLALEYNSIFPPPIRWIMAYNDQHVWRGDMYFGCSLQSYTDLCENLGYQLVGCNITGSNAFFVLRSEAAGKFSGEGKPEELYHPARHSLGRTLFRAGYRPRFGPYEPSLAAGITPQESVR
jgi:hypothetical protein